MRVTPHEVLDKLDALGIKKSHCATCCGISSQIFSDWLYGRKLLSYRQQRRLSEYLSQFDEIIKKYKREMI